MENQNELATKLSLTINFWYTLIILVTYFILIFSRFDRLESQIQQINAPVKVDSTVIYHKLLLQDTNIKKCVRDQYAKNNLK